MKQVDCPGGLTSLKDLVRADQVDRLDLTGWIDRAGQTCQVDILDRKTKESEHGHLTGWIDEINRPGWLGEYREARPQGSADGRTR